jgi:hypothetical protein
MKKFSIRLTITLAAILGLAILAVSPAMAMPLTFAQYIQLNGTTQQWTVSTAAGTTTVSASGQEIMLFSVPLTPALSQPRIANFTLNATSTQTGDCDVAGCLSGSYTQSGYTGTFSFIDPTLPAGMQNLLSGSFHIIGNPKGSGAQLTASVGGNEAAFSGTATLANLGQLVFTSDYLDFSSATLEGASWSLSSLIPSFGVDGGPRPAGTFHAAGSGTFSYDSPIPEPATLSLIGGALLGLGMLRRKMLSR